MADHLHALPEGHRIGPYELQGVLSSGEAGIKYFCLDHESGQRVAAMECLPTALATRQADGAVVPQSSATRAAFEELLEQFLEEAELATRFRHPGLVPIHRSLRANGTGYVVLDYVEGETLAAVLARTGAMDEGEAAALATPLVDCVAAMHAAHLLHLDIRPGNIVIGSESSPILLSYGLGRHGSAGARHALGERRRRPRMSVPPTAYSAFELYSRQGRVGPRTDMYGLAATLYHCIAGQPPSSAPDRLMEDDVVALAEHHKGLADETFLAAIDHALSVLVEGRPEATESWRERLSGTARGPRRDRARTGGARMSARGPVRAVRSPTEAATAPKGSRRWVVPALALTAATALVSYLDTGVLRAPRQEVPALATVDREQAAAVQPTGADDLEAGDRVDATDAPIPGESSNGALPSGAELEVAGAERDVADEDEPEAAAEGIRSAGDAASEPQDPDPAPYGPPPSEMGALGDDDDLAVVDAAEPAPPAEAPAVGQAKADTADSEDDEGGTTAAYTLAGDGVGTRTGAGDEPLPQPTADEQVAEAVPAEESVAVDQVASLAVHTEPSGVEVWLDGELVGETPLELSGIRAGSHDISLRHRYFETIDLPGQEVAAADLLSIERTLTRGTGSLEITTEPAGAWVEWRGDRVAETTPATLRRLPAGPQELTIGAIGFRAETVAADVPQNGTGALTHVLAASYGTLVLDLVPEDAAVALVGGGDEVYTPGMRLREGYHDLEVSRAGYRKTTRRLLVSGDTRLQIDLDLLPLCELRVQGPAPQGRYPARRGATGERSVGSASMFVTFTVDDDGSVTEDDLAVDVERSQVQQSRHFTRFANAAKDTVLQYRFAFTEPEDGTCTRRQRTNIVIRFRG